MSRQEVILPVNGTFMSVCLIKALCLIYSVHFHSNTSFGGSFCNAEKNYLLV